MKTLKKSVLESKILELFNLTGTKQWYTRRALSIIDKEILTLMHEKLKEVPEKQRVPCFVKMLKTLLPYNRDKSNSSVSELSQEFIAIVGSTRVKLNEERSKNETPEMNLSETNGVDIRGCQCFTCRNKNNKEALVGYYTGAYEAYKEAIGIIQEQNCKDKADCHLIKSILSKLEYERDCSGALLEEAEMGK